MKHLALWLAVALLWSLVVSSSWAQCIGTTTPTITPTYPPTLTDELTGQPVSSATTKCIVLIHGWNPGADAYAANNSLEFSALLINLKLKLNGSGWGIIAYHWETDASTGFYGSIIPDVFQFDDTDANQAAANAQLHGNYLAAYLNNHAPNLREVHLIAHSAGSWAARKAAEQLLQLNPYVVVQVTLLDPYIPCPNGGGDFSDTAMSAAQAFSGNDRLQRLENYYAKDDPVHGWNAFPWGNWTWPTLDTQEPFSWRSNPTPIDINQEIDWGNDLVNPPYVPIVMPIPPSFFYKQYYDWHSGPIQFYADTVDASISGHTAKSSLPTGPPDYDYRQIGWSRSLYAWEAYLPQISAQPVSQSASAGGSAIFSVSANLATAIAWYKVGGNWVGSGSTLTLNNVSSSDAGSYVARVSNSNGQLYSQPASLTVGPAVPSIVSVAPSTLTGVSLPQTQRIQIIGSGFTSSSTLVFSDGVNSYNSNPARLTLMNANEIDYLIAVGVNPANWTVKVINGAQMSNLGTFSVVSPSSAINLTCYASPSTVSPNSAFTVSGTATYNNGGGNVIAGTVTIVIGGQTYTAAISSGSYSRLISAPSAAGTYSLSATVTDGSGLTGANSASLVVTSNGNPSGYTINSFLTCSNADSASPYDAYGIIDGFSSSAPRLYAWLELGSVTGSHSVEFRLYRPDGTYYGNSTGTAGTAGQTYDSWRIWSYWPVSGSGIPYIPGLWNVQLYIDGVYQQSIPFTIRYQLTEHLMAKGVQSTTPFDPIQPSNIFYQTDQEALTWLNLDKVSDAINVKWIFYEPNGSEYIEETFSSPSPSTSGYGYWLWYKYWGAIGITGNSAANKCGHWHVDVMIQDPSANWVNQYTDYFQIIESPASPPVCAVVLTSTNPVSGQTLTLNASATDNTYLQSLVLYWNDGTLHSHLWNNVFSNSLNQSQSIGPYSTGQQIAYWAVATDTSGNTTESIHKVGTVAPQQYTVTVSAGVGGGITPNGNLTEIAGVNQTFTAIPGANYTVNQWLLDGNVVQLGGASYSLNNIQTNHDVHVLFFYILPILVSNNQDSGPGSLRQAIQTANTLGGGTITFSNVTGTIVLTNGPLTISQPGVNIIGPGPTNLVISGNQASGVFYVGSSASSSFFNLSIQNGSAGLGGGIYNIGTLSLSNCVVANNNTTLYTTNMTNLGGGIYNGGTVALTNCVVTNNLARSYQWPGFYNNPFIAGLGGGIYNQGTLVLYQSMVIGNWCGDVGNTYATSASGGGIYNSNSATIILSTIANNRSAKGFDCYCGVEIGAGGAGGGICNSGTLFVDRSTVSGNVSGNGGSGAFDWINGADGGPGGGIWNSGQLTITSSTVNGNSSGNGGVGLALSSSRQGGGGGGGGGIYNAGVAALTNCTIFGNVAGNGGFGGVVSGGPAGVQCPGGNGGNGGGLLNKGILIINCCTVSGGISGAGGPGTSTGTNGMGGGIWQEGSVVQLFNTLIVSNNAVGAGADVTGTFISLGFNLIGSTNGSSGFGTTGDLFSVNPRLGPLAYNGGSTPTCALLPASPAIDAGNDSVTNTLVTDQRGYPRRVGTHVDIGAVEGVYNAAGPGKLTGMTRLTNGIAKFTFTNYSEVSFTVLASTNLALPVTQWSNLGSALELPIGSGHYQFTDPQATNNIKRFYRVRTP